MANEPLTGARIPEGNWVPDIALYIRQAVEDLADVAVPQFETVAARNAAYGAWVAAGNAMRNGLMCAVAGYPHMYRAGAWRGVGSTVFEGAKKTTGLTFSETSSITSVNIPDPGYTYRIDVSGALWAYCTPGSVWNLQYRLDSTSGTLIPTPAVVPEDAPVREVLGPRGVSQPLTGPHVLHWVAGKISGSGSMVMGGDTNLQSFVAIMVPVL